jgi:hypothetical protein
VAQTPTKVDPIDNPIERLRLLGDDDTAVTAFLDQLDVRGPRERAILSELARPRSLAEPEQFPGAHRHAVEALEALGRHGYHGSTAGRGLGPARAVVRFLVELVARYVVVSHLRQVSLDLRNLYWLREMQSLPGTEVRRQLRRARLDAEGLVVVFRRREIGLPSFVVGGLLLPVVLSAGRLASGALGSPIQATIVGAVGTSIVVVVAWIILRGAAMASRRIRLATTEPLWAVWHALGWCGRPPRDQSRKLAFVAIALTTLAWIVLPVAVGIAFATT